MTPASPRSPGLRRLYLVGFVLLMGLDALAQVSVKLTAQHALPLEWSFAWALRVVGHPWLYAALLGYLGAFITWMTLLEQAPIGPAFAASHLEVVPVVLLSAWLFEERIGAAQVIGGLLIIAGIVCLAVGESGAAPAPGAEADRSPPA